MGRRDSHLAALFQDSFESLDRPSNPDYFIASIFTHVHLQRQGNLNLFGYSSSVPFLRKTLEKYGCKVHVYKHGDYKNAPNMFTETQFTKPHKQNVETYLFALNNYMFDDISQARRGLHLNSDMWKLIQNSGTFTSSVAKKMGFVDFTPEKSPLEALLSYNSQKTKEDEKEALKAKWGSLTDLDSFPADEQISLSDYRAIIFKRKRLDAYQWRVYKILKEAAEKHSSVRSLLGIVGVSSPRFNFSQVRHNFLLGPHNPVCLKFAYASMGRSIYTIKCFSLTCRTVLTSGGQMQCPKKLLFSRSMGQSTARLCKKLHLS